MIDYAIYDDEGKYLQRGKVTDSLCVPEGNVYLGKVDPTNQYHNTEQNTPTNFPDKPFSWYKFNYSTKLWFDPRELDEAREQKSILIEAKRDEKISVPIVFLGVLLDADFRAQANITNKINEFESRLSLGQEVPSEQLVWRDANNINTTFTSRVDMLLWLRGLAVSISERGTAAYAWSWAKKAEVLSATTLEEIDAVTLT